MKLSELYLLEDALEDLNIELGLMQIFGFSHPDAEKVTHWLNGDVKDMPEQLWDYFMDHYASEIPYSVAKHQIPISAEEWFQEQIENALMRLEIQK